MLVGSSTEFPMEYLHSSPNTKQFTVKVNLLEEVKQGWAGWG